MTDIDAEIGNQLQRLRADQGWSIPELSKRARVSSGDLASWENGSQRVRAADLYRLVAALGCRVEDVYRPVSALIHGERQLAEVFGAQHRDL